MPLACAVPITVRRLCCANTRSTAIAVGRCCSSAARIPCDTASSRCSSAIAGGVCPTPTETSVARRSGATSTTPMPHRVRPGSTPSTRMSRDYRAHSHMCSNGQRVALLVLVEDRLHVGGDLVIAEDVLNVIALFERVDQPDDLARRLEVDLDVQVRHELGVGGVVV